MARYLKMPATKLYHLLDYFMGSKTFRSLQRNLRTKLLPDTSVIKGSCRLFTTINQFWWRLALDYGALTEPVGELVDHLTVVELDRDLARTFTSSSILHQNRIVIETDAMQFDFGELTKKLLKWSQKLRVFGNTLPYFHINVPFI